jgi:hypothetical protein
VDEVVEQEKKEKKFAPIGAISITYNVAQLGSYARLQTQLHQVLATNRIVETIPVMVRQTAPAAPPTWILVPLTGRSIQEKLTMAVRNDNGYVVGFSNSAGTWFAFPRFQRLLQVGMQAAARFVLNFQRLHLVHRSS